MKKEALLILGLLLTGCGKSEEASTAVAPACSTSAILGSWTNLASTTDSITFKSDCTGTTGYCGGTFTFPNVTSTSGNVLLTVTSSNGKSGCLAAGTYTCAYTISGSYMGYNCGTGNFYYSRQ